MSFEERLKYDAMLKSIAKEFFQTFLSNRVFAKDIGQENLLSEVHEHIRFKRDKTTEFVRYMPDLFIFGSREESIDSWLLELKSATTGLQKENSRIMKTIRDRIKDAKKEEILNIELGSWENLIRLRQIGLNVAILAYVGFHPETKWLIILPDNNLNVLPLSREEMAQSQGSGTPIANIFIRINESNVFAAHKWFSDKFCLDEERVNSFLLEKAKLLEKSDFDSIR